ncbi:MAG: aminoacyl-tRNA hydrolase, partial [Acidimicrobiia bacterium]
EIAEIRVDSEKVVLAAPMLFMNESGGPVSATLRYLKADVADLLVIHDDIDLDFGRLRVQIGGGSGGHNGIRSLEKSLGTREFSRLKVGVGRPPGRQDPADFVLRRFGSKERIDADLLVVDAADVVELWVTDPQRAQEQAAHRPPA